jgi:hypothetical protein
VRGREVSTGARGPRNVDNVRVLRSASPGASDDSKLSLCWLLAGKLPSFLDEFTPEDARALLLSVGDGEEDDVPTMSLAPPSRGRERKAGRWEDVEPTAFVKDVFREGDQVLVSLCNDARVTHDGKLATSDFFCDAYLRSEDADLRRENRAVEQKLDAERVNACEEERLGTVQRTAARLFATHVRSGDGKSSRSMFEFDWAKLRGALTFCPAESLESVRQTTMEHHTAVRDVFRFFSNLFGTGENVGGSFSMDQNEFLTIILNSKYRLFGAKPKDAFLLATGGDADSSACMGRAQFLDGLLCLSALVQGMKTAKLYGRGEAPEPELSVEGVQDVMAVVVLPTLLDAMTSTKMQRLLCSPECMDLLFPKLDVVQAYFKHSSDGFQAPDEDAGPDAIPTPAMSLSAWLRALESMGLLDRDYGRSTTTSGDGIVRRRAQMFQGADEDVLTVKEASMAFFLAQSEDESGDDDAGMAQLDEREFVEALAHAACAKWEDDSIPLRIKLERVLRCIDDWAAAREATSVIIDIERERKRLPIPLFSFAGESSALGRRAAIRESIQARRSRVPPAVTD